VLLCPQCRRVGSAGSAPIPGIGLAGQPQAKRDD